MKQNFGHVNNIALRNILCS